MNRCPITYEHCGMSLYSANGLKLLSKNLNKLELFSFTAEEQRLEAFARAVKLSIQGVQPKLSAVLNVKECRFNLVDQGGKYILKPQHHIYPQLPENEDLTMKMAGLAGINVPQHGLIWSKDKSLTYFIKRFDRSGQKDKIAVEDFSQLAGLTRDTKYNYSMEKLTTLIDRYCTFPVIEKSKLFRLVIFNYLVGNEDMHLKNYSVIRNKNRIELAPGYDLLNTTIVLKANAEEIALPLAGKKSKLSRKLLVDYFGREICMLTGKVIDKTLATINQSTESWFMLIKASFLTDDFKGKYIDLVRKRLKVLDL